MLFCSLKLYNTVRTVFKVFLNFRLGMFVENAVNKKILEQGQERQIYVNRLANLGYQVGIKILDLLVLREKQQYRRETKLINMLTFIKTSVWKNLFGKEADKLERANDDERTCENQANNLHKLFV